MTSELPAQRGWWRAAAGVLIVAVLGLVAVGAVFVLADDDDSMAVSAAELVPADTHLFIGLNTDLTSQPWVRLPRLLDALNVEDRAREELDESLAEDDLDLEEDILPIIREITGLAFAGQALSLEEGEGVIVVATRDPEGLLAYLREESTTGFEVFEDPGSGLTFTDFPEEDGDSGGSVTIVDGVVYMGIGVDLPGSRDAIRSHLDRMESEGPLSKSDDFRALVKGIGADAMTVLWVSGEAAEVIDDRELLDAIETVEDESEIDVSSFRMVSALVIESNAFRADTVWRVDSLGDFEPTTAEHIDIDVAASTVPATALYFQASTGLGVAFEELLDSLENADDVTSQDFLEGLDQIESDVGIDIRDLVANLAGMQVFAVGNILDYPEPTGIEYVLAETQAGDLAMMRADLGRIIEYIEDELCVCDSDIAVDEEAGFVRVFWPENEALGYLDAPPLSGSDAFNATIDTLPDEPEFLMFFNIAALPDEVFEDAGDDGEFDQSALIGFALTGTSLDERTVQLSAVLAIDTD